MMFFLVLFGVSVLFGCIWLFTAWVESQPNSDSYYAIAVMLVLIIGITCLITNAYEHHQLHQADVESIKK